MLSLIKYKRFLFISIIGIADILLPNLAFSKEELYVSALDQTGTTYAASKSGTYRFVITGGAYENTTPEGRPDLPEEWGWLSKLLIYKNRSIEWNTPCYKVYQESSKSYVEYPGPVNWDFELGSWTKYETYQEAENHFKGLHIDITLDQGDYVTFVTMDCKDCCFLDNYGGVYLSAKLISTVGDNNLGKPQDGNASQGDPVNVINGNMHIIKKDFSNPAPGIPFEFIRTYNSMDEAVGSLGAGWTHNFNVTLTPPSGNTSSAVIRDADERIITFSKDTSGNFQPMTGEYSNLTKTDSGYTWEKKEKIKYNFNSDGQLQSIKDRNSNTIWLEYTDGRLKTLKDTVGRKYELAYDTDNHITTITNPVGKTVSYEYDSNGNLIKITDPTGVVTEYEYNDSNDKHNITKQTIDSKFVYTYSYDGQDQCKSATGSNGEQGYGFQYTSDEGSAVMPDSRGNVTTKYHSSGKVSRIVYPDSSEEKFNWDKSLNKTSETLQDDSTWKYEYDENGNITKATDSLGYQKSMSYDENDNLTSLTDELGNTTSYTYDGNGNLTKITYTDGTYTIFTYNSRGQPLTITDPLSKTTTFSYGSQGNLNSVTDPKGNTVTFAYDSLGRKTSETDARGNVTKYEYDALNRVTKVTDAQSGEINTTHEIAGLKSLKDQNSNTTTFQYDSLNQLISVTDPLGKTKQFSYDDMGNLTSRTDFNGNTTNYTYDDMDRLTTIKYPDNSQVTFSYDAVGRPTQMTDSTGSSAYTYDTTGRITAYTNGKGLSVSYAYNKAGNLTSLTYPGSKTVTYTYDSQNRLTQVKDWADRQTTYSYDNRGLLTNGILPNGTMVQYGYNSAGRMTSLKNLKSDNTVIASYSYSLDKNGNITSETVNQPIEPTIESQSVNYTYGSDNRLSSTNSTSFTYDQNGNLTSSGSASYQYDYENRLKKVVTSDGTWEHEYDSQGNRIGLKNNSGKRQFLVDPTGMIQVLAEYDGSSNLVAYYIYGLGLMYKVDASGNPYYYHYSFTGNTVAITDANGNIVNKYAYTPFGTVENSEESVSNPFRYVGKYGVMDDKNGLLYMRARYYDPEVGRFITKDPIGFAGGDSNLYSYVLNNPVNLNDYTGLCTDEPDWDWYDIRAAKKWYMDRLARKQHWVLAGIVGTIFDLTPLQTAQELGEALGTGRILHAAVALAAITAPSTPLKYIKVESKIVTKYGVLIAEGWEKVPHLRTTLHWLLGGVAGIFSQQEVRN